MRLRGETEQALRWAASLLNATTDDLGAAALLARLLLDAERASSAAEVALRLLEGWIRRGDLPQAWIAAQIALEAGGYADDALPKIAAAFGKDSPRLSNTAPKPPALPADIDIAPLFAQLSGAPLLDAAEKVAARFLKTRDKLPADGEVPDLPLFSQLEPARLAKLLSRMELRELDAGAYVVRKGEEGRKAFVLARGLVNVVREDGKGGSVLLASLGPGAIFGEMALVSQAPRAASVVAVEPVQLLSIERSALEELAVEDPAIGRELGGFCYSRMISNLIRHSVLFTGLEPAERTELIGRFTSQRFERGQYLVQQGQELGCLFLLASGEVQVRSTDADGERVVLAQLGPGDVVGEISLVLRRPANADVMALHSTVALALTREQFEQAFHQHPTLLRELYDIAVQRAEETRSVVAQKATDVSDIVLL